MIICLHRVNDPLSMLCSFTSFVYSTGVKIMLFNHYIKYEMMLLGYIFILHNKMLRKKRMKRKINQHSIISLSGLLNISLFHAVHVFCYDYNMTIYILCFVAVKYSEFIKHKVKWYNTMIKNIFSGLSLAYCYVSIGRKML